LPQLLDKSGQGLSLDELHGVEVDAAFAADEINRHDVLMLEMSGRVGLVLKALKLLGVQGSGKGQNFQGHASAERDLLGLVNHAHAAATDFAENAEVAEGSGDGFTSGR